MAFGPRNFSRKKAQKAQKYTLRQRYGGTSFSGFWILSEDRLLTPARPRYLLTPDSFFMPASPLSTLLDLSHELGREERALAILGEGNTSTRVSESTFLVKASGSNLATLAKEGLTECRFADLH